MSEPEVIVTKGRFQWNFASVEEASQFLLGRVPFDGPVYRIWFYLPPEALNVLIQNAKAARTTQNPGSSEGRGRP